MVLLLCATLSLASADSLALRNDADVPAGEFFCLKDRFYGVEMSELDINAAFDKILCFRCQGAGIFKFDAMSEYPFRSMEVLTRKSDTGKAVPPYRIILDGDACADLSSRESKHSTIEFVLESNGMDDDSAVSKEDGALLLANAYLSDDARIASKYKDRARELTSLPYLTETSCSDGSKVVRLFNLSGASGDYSFGHVLRRNVVCCKVPGIGVVQDVYWPQSFKGMNLRHRGLKLMLPADSNYLCSFAKYYRYPKSDGKIAVVVRYAVFLQRERLFHDQALAKGIVEAEFDIAKRRLVVIDRKQPDGVKITVESRTLPFLTVDSGRMIEVQLENGVYRRDIANACLEFDRNCSGGIVEWKEIVLSYKNVKIPLKGSLPDEDECAYAIQECPEPTP